MQTLQKNCFSATHICNAICVAEKFCNAQCVAENAMQKTGLQIFCNASQRCVAKICNAMCVADFKKIRNAIRNVRCRLPKNIKIIFNDVSFAVALNKEYQASSIIFNYTNFSIYDPSTKQQKQISPFQKQIKNTPPSHFFYHSIHSFKINYT